MKYKIYCDMDGVLCNFTGGYHELTGKDIEGQWHDSPEFWEPVDKAGEKFWVDLKWMKDGKKLWDHIKKYDPEILSSPSKKDESRTGKHKWIKRELPGVHLILRMPEYKKEFAAENHILIDDRDANIKSWTDAGGIGILHKSAEDTIKKLKEYEL